ASATWSFVPDSHGGSARALDQEAEGLLDPARATALRSVSSPPPLPSAPPPIRSVAAPVEAVPDRADHSETDDEPAPAPVSRPDAPRPHAPRTRKPRARLPRPRHRRRDRSRRRGLSPAPAGRARATLEPPPPDHAVVGGRPPRGPRQGRLIRIMGTHVATFWY